MKRRRAMRDRCLVVCFWLLLVASSAVGQPFSFQPAIQQGMGDANNVRATEMAVMNGYLYVGLNNEVTGCEVWRVSILPRGLGNDWVQVNNDAFGAYGSRQNDVIRAMQVFQGKLYVGTGNDQSIVWKTAAAGVPPFLWPKSGTNGFGDPTNRRVNSMAVYDSHLFAGIRRFDLFGGPLGGRVYTTSDGTTWAQVGPDGFGDANNESVTSLVSFNGHLYAGTRNDVTGVEIWRTGGSPYTSWEQVNTDGFGDANNDHASSIAVFNGRLYVGTENLVTGAEVWSTAGVGGPPFTDWVQSNTDGFGDSTNGGAMAMLAQGPWLLVGTENSTNTGQLWAMDLGGTWTRNPLYGFAGNERIAGMAADTTVYLGTGNAAGGEVWDEIFPETVPALAGPGIGLLAVLLALLGLTVVYKRRQPRRF
jgi:hypothetical protein